MFNIKKGIVPGADHNAPTLRDKSAAGAYSVTNNLCNAPEVMYGKATKFIVGGYNAPELMQQPKGKKVGSILGK